MQYITISSGVAVADTSNGESQFKITLTGNVSSFSISGNATQPVTVLFEQDATGGRTVAFDASISSPPTIDSTASSVTVATFSFDGNANTWVTGANAISGASPSTVVGSIALAAQAANITTANAAASVTAGTYRVGVYIVESQAATTSSTMPAVTIGWTDETSTAQTDAVTTTSTGNAIGTYAQGSVVIRAKGATNITYATGSYASSGATAMQYDVYVSVERL